MEPCPVARMGNSTDEQFCLQWNDFQNADTELTYTQMDSDKDEDSPVRPRAALDTMALRPRMRRHWEATATTMAK